MMAAAAAAAASGGPPPLPPPNAADTLRTMLSSNTRQWTQPTESGGVPNANPPKKRKIIHQVFKDPLVVTNHQKIGQVPNGKGPIVYKEVADPSDNDTTYMMCGECESLKLFRNFTSLYKHRAKECCSHINSEAEDVVEEPSSITLMAVEAKKFLNNLSTDELLSEYKQIYSVLNPPGVLSRETLVEAILKHALGDVEEPESVQICADIPPLSVIDTAMFYVATLWPRMHATSLAHPNMSPLLLAVSAISDCDPSFSKPRSFDVEIQTNPSRYEVRSYTGTILVNEDNRYEPEMFDKRIQCEEYPATSRVSVEFRNSSTKQKQSEEISVVTAANTNKRKASIANLPKARRSNRLRRRE